MTDDEIAAHNESIYLPAVTRAFMEQKAATQYVIRHLSTRLYWHGTGVSLGDIWGGLDQARRFDGISVAYTTAIFECREPEAGWDVVAVEGR